jgi:hypothetical protein
MKSRSKVKKERLQDKIAQNSFIFEKEGKSIQFYKLIKDASMGTDQVS